MTPTSTVMNLIDYLLVVGTDEMREIVHVSTVGGSVAERDWPIGARE